MAEFLTTDGITNEVTNIIRKAEKILIIVSPYVQLSEMLFERLKDADNRDVKIFLIYGKKKELEHSERWQLMQLKNLSVYFYNNLHAKCYLNEDCMVVTSWNFYEASEKNREMGVLVRRNNDTNVFNDAFSEVQSIINVSEKLDFSKDSPLCYCIRCKREIFFDHLRPYCEEHLTIWSKFNNPDYSENYCHTCGEKYETSQARPSCAACLERAIMVLHKYVIPQSSQDDT